VFEVAAAFVDEVVFRYRATLLASSDLAILSFGGSGRLLLME